MAIRKRITLFLVCIIFCVSATMIPVSADGEYCDTHGHTWKLSSHGSIGEPSEPDNANCYTVQHWQCFFYCYYCAATIMANEFIIVPHAWSFQWNDIGGGWDFYCAKCGIWRSSLD